MKDLFEKILTKSSALGQYAEQAEGIMMFPELEGPIGPRMMYRGHEYIVWSINNYLGLANHPHVRKADAKAAEQWGAAYPMGARMMSGQTSLHTQLEQNLAEFEQKESAYLLNYGYQGVLSIIDSMVDRHDVIVYDAESHACIVDGVRLHAGLRIAFRHNDVEHLDQCLQRATAQAEKQGGAIFVISEGVFGMRGDQGRLKEIVALKSKYNFRLFVDDAHGFGTLGKTGMGAGEEQGVQDQIDLYFGTFAKSMASIGAFVAGPQKIIQYLKYTMRSQIFAKSLPMVLVEGALKRLEMLRTMPELKATLWQNATALQTGFRERGFDLGITESCITPVYVDGDVQKAIHLVGLLREKHRVFCSAVVYPVVPKGIILIRLIPTAAHQQEDIDLTLKAFEGIKSAV
jgi:glycine C-acetyltransferase